MRTVAALLVGFCALYQTVAVPWNDQTEGRREARAVTEPNPVDCSWSRWSEWTPCEPCTKIRYRVRGVEVFGQFGGKTCVGALGDQEACTTDAVCKDKAPTVCSDSEFQCKSGACILRRLVCNGDFDCDDASDETCETVTERNKPCSPKVLDNNEQGRTAGYGMNILGGDPYNNAFFNDFFNGQCTRVRNPKSLNFDRLPWNVAVLNYETLAEEEISREIYEDTHTLLKELLDETKDTLNAGLSFKLSPSEKSNRSLSAGVGADIDYDKKKMLKDVSEYTTTKKKSFIRVKGKVQLSTYRMRTHDLNVATGFLDHVKTLPLEYEKGQYFQFLEEYGTHYTKNGKSGGEYELIYVLNQDIIKQKHVTQTGLSKCLKGGVTANFDTGTGIGGEGHIKPGHCTDLTKPETDDNTGNALVDKVLTSVLGGSPESAAAMRAKLNKDGQMDVQTYQTWARTLADFPALISSEPEPIHTLIPLSMPDANIRRTNLRQATEDYVAEYNLCKCKPCSNGGTLVLLNGKCLCLCSNLFEGLACQNVKTDKNKDVQTPTNLRQEGNWSCWSGWSSCSKEKRTRSRSCNTEGVTGATCRGDTVSEDYC